VKSHDLASHALYFISGLSSMVVAALSVLFIVNSPTEIGYESFADSRKDKGLCHHSFKTLYIYIVHLKWSVYKFGLFNYFDWFFLQVSQERGVAHGRTCCNPHLCGFVVVPTWLYTWPEQRYSTGDSSI